MSKSSQQAVLEFEITINVKASAETKKLIDDLKKAKKQKQESGSKSKSKTSKQTTTDAEEGPKVETNETDEEEPSDVIEEGNLKDLDQSEFFKSEVQRNKREKDALNKEVVDTFNKMDSEGLGTISKLATNPAGAVTDFLMMALGDSALVAELASGIGVVVAAPAVGIMVLQQLSKKGGPLNRDFVNAVNKIAQVGLDRQTIKDTQFGNQMVVLAQKTGFVPNNANWTYSNLYTMDAKRASRIGLSDYASGVFVS